MIEFEKLLKIQCRVEITENVMRHIMDQAIDGSMHWVTGISGDPNGKADLSKQFVDGCHLTIRNGITGEIHTLSINNMMEGIKTMLESADYVQITPEWDNGLILDLSETTEEMADEMLQFALFGRIKYREGVQVQDRCCEDKECEPPYGGKEDCELRSGEACTAPCFTP